MSFGRYLCGGQRTKEILHIRYVEIHFVIPPQTQTALYDQISFDFVDNCWMLESVESSYTENNNWSE